MTGEPVEEEFARSIAHFYRPPRRGQIKAAPKNGKTVKLRSRAILCTMMLHRDKFSPEEERMIRTVRKVAKRRLDKPRSYNLDEIIWETTAPQYLQLGTIVLQCTGEHDGSSMLSPPSRVVGLRRYRKNRVAIVLAVPKGIRRKNFKVVSRQQRAIKQIQKGSPVKRVTDPKLHDAIASLWPQMKAY